MNPTMELQEATSVSLKSILFATDFSVASEKAFEHASALARRHDCKFSVVHVIPQVRAALVPALEEDLQWQHARQAMDILAGRDELKHTRHQLLLRRGSVWNALSNLIQEEAVDLLVVGTHGRGGLEKLIVGSIAEEMVRLATCAVMTVGPNAAVPSPLSGEFHRILFATDFSPASEKALPYATFFAQQSGAKLMLLHVVQGAPLPSGELGSTFYDEATTAKWESETRAVTLERLKELLSAEATTLCKPNYEVAFGIPTTEILYSAEKHQSDLIVIGAKRVVSAAASAHISWAASHELICHAMCPVLTIRE
ncbi:MAG TPA: universal stress protein [Terriglobales bacterium]|nr:universal stress protein [Terriglobales bacterium]